MKYWFLWIHVVLCVADVRPTEGDLDPTFGTGGCVITDVGAVLSVGQSSGSRINAVALQTDGKIVTAGDFDVTGIPYIETNFTVARYNTNGTLDTTFGTGGCVITNFATILSLGTSTGDPANGLVIQTDGKIVAVGTFFHTDLSGDFALARYNTDGTLDSTFGTDGCVITDFGTVLSLAAGSSDSGNAVVLQSDGKIVVAGVSNATGSFQVALARYNTNGTLDSTFGTGGCVLTDVGTVLSLGASSSSRAFSVVIQNDGKIVIAGSSSVGVTPTNVLVARYNTDGTLDNSFGTGGCVSTNIHAIFSTNSGSVFSQARAVVLQSDGKIVAVGSSTALGSQDFALIRYNTDGTLDSTFGSTGCVLTDIGTVLSLTTNSFDRAFAAALQTNGTIVAVGFSNATGNFDFALARYNTDGTLDSTFGTGGCVITDFGPILSLSAGAENRALAMVVQSDSKIVATGLSAAGGLTNAALARYNATASALPFIADRVVCTPCGPFLMGKRGCKRSWVFKSGGECLEVQFGGFKQSGVINSYPVNCSELMQSTTVCDCV